MRKLLAGLAASAAILLSGCAINQQPTAAQRPDVKQFIHYMNNTYGYNSQELTDLFSTIKLTPKKSTENQLNQPVGRMKERHDFVPWYTYSQFFITQSRIDAGVGYWDKNSQWLVKAQQQYGLPPYIIVATIGIESKYGQQLGSYPVFQSLGVLAFDYTRRKEFFRNELIAYLLYCRSNNISPLSIHGSFAGAIGQPQFMPSSIQHYAVDFDHSGNIDLIHDDADAIGSVAHFYSRNNWLPNQPVASPVIFTGKKWQALLNSGRNKMTIQQFAQYGIRPQQPVAGNLNAKLVSLQTKQGPQYWLIFHNFNVIKNYNNSTDYAMAIYQLGLAIQNQYQQLLAKRYAATHKPIAHTAPKKTKTLKNNKKPLRAKPQQEITHAKKTQ